MGNLIRTRKTADCLETIISQTHGVRTSHIIILMIPTFGIGVQKTKTVMAFAMEA